MAMNKVQKVTGELFDMSRSYHKTMPQGVYEVLFDDDAQIIRGKTILEMAGVSFSRTEPKIGHLAIMSSPEEIMTIEALPGLSLRPANYE